MEDKINLLSSVSLFSALQPEEIRVLADYSDYYSFEPDTTLFEEGSEGEELYVIKTGEVLIYKNTEEGRRVDLARFIDGEEFGELDLLDDVPRNAGCVTVKKTTLLIFPMKGVSFRQVLSGHPKIFAQILHKLLVTMAGRIRNVNTLLSKNTPWIQELKKKLLTDKLTGLYNKTYLDEELQGVLPELIKPVSFIILKPDSFKQVNDTYGHQVGDLTIKRLAKVLLKCLNTEDIAVRYRGDEYAAVLPGQNADTAREKSRQILKAIRNMDLGQIVVEAGLVYKEKIILTASIGLSEYPASEDFVAKAFSRMLEAREEGGDSIH